MSIVVACDNEDCISVIDLWQFENGKRNWFTVKRGSGFGAQPQTGPWHFCSSRCVADFIAGKEFAT